MSQITNIPTTIPSYDTVIQQIRNRTNNVVYSNVQIPIDDTIPQQTEGTEVLTVTITPTYATSILVVEFSGWGGSTNGSGFVPVAMFQDAGLDAIETMLWFPSSNGPSCPNLVFRHYLTSGAVVPTTFKVRLGTENPGDEFYLNGSPYGAGRLFGGSSYSTLTVTEYVS